MIKIQNTVKPHVTMASIHLPRLQTGPNPGFMGPEVYTSWGTFFKKEKQRYLYKIKYGHGFLFGVKKIFDV